jgi:hypothetical protein
MSSEKNMTEVYFEWWLEELKAVGLVKSYEREPQTFVLMDAEPIFYNQHYKSKEPLVKNFNLFRPITYTPDYKVVFSIKLVSKLFGYIDRNKKIIEDYGFKEPGSVYQETLCYTIDEHDAFKGGIEVWFDVKPPAKALQFSGQLGSSREFPYNQRLMYEKHNIIVNKVVPIGSSTSLFAKTFLPNRYRWTDKSGAIRQLKPYEAKAKTLQQYLESKKINL